jgi:hypothetical protein
MAKGDQDDPAWRYITAALTRAGNLARSKGYAWKGGSCYLVSSIALRMVILTRNGEKTPAGDYLVPTTNTADINLAYADHYLHMRGTAAFFGPDNLIRHRMAIEKLKIVGYDEAKRVILGMEALPDEGPDAKPLNGLYKATGKALHWALREGKQPLSSPTALSQYWANEGLKDGLDDHANNPGIDNDPDRIKL